MLPLLRSFIKEKALHKYTDAVWTLVTHANKYIDTQAPWALRKTNKSVLYPTAELLRCLGILLQPLMPHTCDQLLNQLGIP